MRDNSCGAMTLLTTLVVIVTLTLSGIGAGLAGSMVVYWLIH